MAGRLRHDFSSRVQRTLAGRVSHLCSNPGCRAPTVGPQLKDGGSVNVGKAAHITAASPGGPRYDPSLSPEQRAAASNGIWLCAICADVVDKDETGYLVGLLRVWKADAEREARLLIGKAKHHRPSSGKRELQIKRDLRLRDRMRADFLRPYDPDGSRRERSRPPDRMVHRKIIVHSVEDATYGNWDAPAKSGFTWFRVEPYDFYFGGLMVILDLVPGIMDSSGLWDVIAHNAPVDTTKFQVVTIYELGKIPWRNIRHYDPEGDEYYNEPHLYCLTESNGWPYEGRAHVLLGKDYDWHLDPKKRLRANKE